MPDLLTVAALYIDPRGTLASRFWSKVDKNGPVIRPDLGPCWMWTASADRKGYGQITCRRAGKRKRPERAHRVAWYLEHGRDPLPCALHHCDNRRCVRPAHLFEGTVADNNRDMDAKGRSNRPCFSQADRAAAVARLPRGDTHYARSHPGRLARGESHGATRLKQGDVDEMRSARAAGASLKALAERYRLSEPGVSAICTGRNWRPAP